MQQLLKSTKSLGFTLVETLVVLTIVGVMLGLVVVKFSQDDRQQLQQEAHRLALLLNHASITARSTGRTIAWEPNTQGYAFMQLESGTNVWKTIPAESQLRTRILPDNMHLNELRIAGNIAKQNERIIFSPSGLTAPFSMHLVSNHLYVNVNGNLLGKVINSAVIETQ